MVFEKILNFCNQSYQIFPYCRTLEDEQVHFDDKMSKIIKNLKKNRQLCNIISKFARKKIIWFETKRELGHKKFRTQYQTNVFDFSENFLNYSTRRENLRNKGEIRKNLLQNMWRRLKISSLVINPAAAGARELGLLQAATNVATRKM